MLGSSPSERSDPQSTGGKKYFETLGLNKTGSLSWPVFWKGAVLQSRTYFLSWVWVWSVSSAAAWRRKKHKILVPLQPLLPGRIIQQDLSSSSIFKTVAQLSDCVEVDWQGDIVAWWLLLTKVPIHGLGTPGIFKMLPVNLKYSDVQ